MNACARLIRPATKPGGTRSRTHTLHGTAIRNEHAPTIAEEVDRSIGIGSIVAVHDEVMPEHRSTQQLHCRVLLRRWKCSEARGMRDLRDHPALSQVGSLLDPAAEGHAAALEPRIELRHSVGAIVGMEQCVCERLGMIDVDGPRNTVAIGWVAGNY